MEIRGNSAFVGMNRASIPSQLKEGELTFALNAQIEGFDGNTVTYQNEQGNLECFTPPEGYTVVGSKNIIERDYTVYFLANSLGDSEIGKCNNNTCEYTKLINDPCIGFSLSKPVHKIVTKVTNCTTELYWTNGDGMRWIDLDNLPFLELNSGNCENTITDRVDCNKMYVQPNFYIPVIDVKEVGSHGNLQEGTYQFGIQYSSSQGDPYSSVYGITNPFSIHDNNRITNDFNLFTGKSITFDVYNLDDTGIYDYINLIVIKTVNNISSFELIDTRKIVETKLTYTYTGASKTDIKLSANDIFESFPVYDKVDDVFSVQDIVGWSGLTLPRRKNYQKIFNRVELQWQSFIFNSNKKEDYSQALNTGKYRGYMRDESYALEGVFYLTRGRKTDSFHIPSRVARQEDLETIANGDVTQLDGDCVSANSSSPRWRVYNTATKLGSAPEYNPEDPCYEGPYEYGEFAYTESTDVYPCDADIWGELAGKPIRHHKFPDSLISHIHDNVGNIFPIGIKVDIDQIKRLIAESDLTQEEKDEIIGIKIVRGNRAANKSIQAKGLIFNVGKYTKNHKDNYYPNYPYNDLRPDPFISTALTGVDSGSNPTFQLDGFSSIESKQRVTLHSPDTAFYQPNLGNELKLETIEYGQSTGHFVQVEKHSKYKFLTRGTYSKALGIGILVGVASMSLGLGSTQIFDGTAAFTAFNAIVNIIEKTIPRVNYAYQYNSVGNYDKYTPVLNNGNKVRRVDLAQYIISGINSTGDIHPINNFQRESSVYLKTTLPFPFPHEQGAPIDTSRWTLGSEGICDDSGRFVDKPISAYYASLKRNLVNQYSTINSFELIDTGFYCAFTKSFQGTRTAFGGDVFINKFGLKRKMPFFIDNRVGRDDESDVFYNELTNVGYATYWLSTDYKNDDTDIEDSNKTKGISAQFKKIFGVKINNFDCRDDAKYYQKGKIYLFAYGIPYFFCESEVNVDFRQATNEKQGDFYPRVGTDVPDQWLQEINVPIAEDNSYTYNQTFSKQAKEEIFSHLPIQYKDECEVNYPNRAIYSDKQEDVLNYKKNSWLVYRPLSQFDFPLNYGKLISLEGVENRAILARFENKSLLYNNLITIDTSGQAAYVGNSKLFNGAPPQDFADTDMGYNGTQHKLFLKTRKGNISIDAKRGGIFAIGGTTALDLAGPEFKMESFFKEHLPFKISKSFPNVNIDNAFAGIGITGVFDNKYNRLILTKLDYEPNTTGITYEGGVFKKDGKEVSLLDENYFCNKSFTISFDFDVNRWISFHSYLPNFYIADANSFSAGIDGTVWVHNKDVTTYNNFCGKVAPYILEYPFSYKVNDEILQSVKDVTRVIKQINDVSYVLTNDVYFNKTILSNDQQCSGILILKPKPKNNPLSYLQYPKYTEDGKEILFSKSDSFYNYNMFNDVVKDPYQPIFMPSCSVIDKELNHNNLYTTPQSFKKAPLRARGAVIRHILDNTSDYRFISEFILTKTTPSYK